MNWYIDEIQCVRQRNQKLHSAQVQFHLHLFVTGSSSGRAGAEQGLQGSDAKGLLGVPSGASVIDTIEIEMAPCSLAETSLDEDLETAHDQDGEFRSGRPSYPSLFGTSQSAPNARAALRVRAITHGARCPARGDTARLGRAQRDLRVLIQH